MNTDKIVELLMYTVPSLITGGVAYFLFTSHFKEQQNSRKWILKRENQKHSLPLRLQAYERLALFLERINPTKLLIRVGPLTDNKVDYQNLLIQHIEQEFEHNLTQQVYISEECWNFISTAKNATIQMIRNASKSEKVDNADKLREVILTDLLEKQSPSSGALSYIKTEVGTLW